MKKILSVSLALTILFANIGFSMNTHFCGGEAVETSFSIGLHNPDCGMDNMDEACETTTPTEEQLIPQPCCENQHQLMQLDENATIQPVTVFTNFAFLAAFIAVFVEPVIIADQTFTQSNNYRVPLPNEDIQVLFQTFII
ncbi:MAG: hypothetical protein M0Q90_09485 [Bacteroidales bacterium]|nr:hypothetical protein [Bacteroidales bacterium]